MSDTAVEADETYGIHSRHYLRRARQRLNEGSQESLFYAAFELRCGVEARLQQYLDAQEEVSEKKKKGWRIAQLARDIEQVFNTGDKIAKIAIRERRSGAVLHEFYFTPVSSKLKKMAGQLGNYLHVAGSYRPARDSWWSEIRAFLECVYEELRRANVGTMLGPPLRKPGTSRVYFSTEVQRGETAEDLIRKVGEAGTPVILEVAYFDDLPDKLL